jgi:hypothetical protein
MPLQATISIDKPIIRAPRDKARGATEFLDIAQPCRIDGFFLGCSKTLRFCNHSVSTVHCNLSDFKYIHGKKIRSLPIRKVIHAMLASSAVTFSRAFFFHSWSWKK